MCETCYQTPCAPRCPNAPLPEPEKCSICNCELEEGFILKGINGKYCTDCVKNEVKQFYTGHPKELLEWIDSLKDDTFKKQFIRDTFQFQGGDDLLFPILWKTAFELCKPDTKLDYPIKWIGELILKTDYAESIIEWHLNKYM